VGSKRINSAWGVALATVTARVTGQPQWVDGAPDPLYAVLHRPEGAERADIAVLILPAFGWDDDCSYRSRRDWATAIAEAGGVAARIDFPGAGDSVGSPLAPGRVAAWIGATTAAATWVRQVSVCDRLVVAGIGLGGFIAVRAALSGAPIDDLILWGVRATGRAHFRELRAYAAVVAGEIHEEPGADPSGVIGIGGHRMSAETAADLSALSLVDTPLPQPQRRRVLLLGRDANGVDETLEGHLRNSGADVTTENFHEYHLLTEPPEYGFSPRRTIAASVDWLFGSRATPGQIEHETPAQVAGGVDCVEFVYDGVVIAESLVEVQSSAGRLVGVVSAPAAGARPSACLVLANAGSLRRTGPNRMGVEIARRAAASGLASARFDLPGLGDSDGDLIRNFDRRPGDDRVSLSAMSAICDELGRQGISDRFVTGGHCLGGYIALRAAVTDERVIAAIVLNAGLALTDAERRRQLMGARQRVGSDLSHRQIQGGRQLAVWSGRLEQAGARFVMSVWERAKHVDVLRRAVYRDQLSSSAKAIDELGAASATRVVIMTSSDERLDWLMSQPRIASRLQRWPNITLERLPGRDHLLRSLAAQDVALDRFADALSDVTSALDSPSDKRREP
jgi:alpha-beta hydrolase superfamily lysophospholipase